MPNKHLQSVNSLKVCQWRSWHNEQQGHLTHNHITTCAFSSILLLSIIPCECNTLFMDVLFTAPDTSPHMFHWICSWFWFVKFIPLFYYFVQNLIGNYQCYWWFPTTVQNPEKNLQSRTWTCQIVICQCCCRSLGCFPNQTFLFIFLICPRISGFYHINNWQFLSAQNLFVYHISFKLVTCISWLLFMTLNSFTILVNSLWLMSFMFDGIKLSGKSLGNRAAFPLRFINHCNWWQMY